MNHLIGLIEIKYSKMHVEKKINFFFNYLRHYAHYIGQSPFYPQDNLLSISQRLLFQLKHNPKNCKKYLRGLRRSFRAVNYDAYSELNSLENVVGVLILESEDHRKLAKMILDNAFIIEYLELFVEELEGKMFSMCIDRLINRLSCEHELEEHIDEIKQMTQVIVTELIFQNHSINETIELVRRILSNDVNFFPLKDEIEQLRGTETFENIATDFMNERNLKEQFEGIHHFYQKKLTEKYFIFRVDNIQFFVDHGFDIDGVFFLSKDEDKFKIIKDKFKDNESIMKFWSVGASCFAFTKVSFFETEIGKNMAMKKIQNALNHINVKLDMSAVLYKRGYLKTNDFEQAGSRQGLGESDLMIRRDKLETLRQDNICSMLSECNSEAKKELESNESLYQKAATTGRPSDYWHYLECLVNNSREHSLDGISVCIYLSQILSQFLNDDHKYDIALSIFETFRTNTNRGNSREFTTAEINKFTSDIEGTDIIELTSRFNYSTLEELKRIYHDAESVGFQEDCFQYLRSVFVELYECRNNDVHMNYSSERSISKMERLIPYYVRKLRFVLTQEILSSTNLNLSSIFNLLIGKYDSNKNAEII